MLIKSFPKLTRPTRYAVMTYKAVAMRRYVKSKSFPKQHNSLLHLDTINNAVKQVIQQKLATWIHCQQNTALGFHWKCMSLANHVLT